jgi:hypothetical protein
MRRVDPKRTRRKRKNCILYTIRIRRIGETGTGEFGEEGKA